MSQRGLRGEARRSLKKAIAALGAGSRREREAQLVRYEALAERHRKEFAPRLVSLFNAPGRAELIGNHTDHNQGRVLAAAVNLDSIAAVSLAGRDRVTVLSEGYGRPFVVDLGRLQVRKRERGSTTALIRGIASRLARGGYRIGGFDATIQSDVLPGSGLSSSASIEVLVATIFNHLFNQGRIGPLEIARIAQFSENRFFGKPCGLMDQVACAWGGILHIDFQDPDAPRVERLAGNFSRFGYALAVVKTGSAHADLTAHYAAIPAEMRTIAGALGRSGLRESSLPELLRHARMLRERCADRAFLRACHFFRENERVARSVRALKERRFARFLELLNDSGRSSFCYLQNAYPPGQADFQPLALALALTENFIARHGRGACRIHGGGFAGTILAVIPLAGLAGYVRMMEAVFGSGCVIELRIRNHGALHMGDA